VTDEDAGDAVLCLLASMLACATRLRARML